MQASEYQQATKQFAIYNPHSAIEYLGLGIASEAGEVAGKVKKYVRGDYVVRDPIGEGLYNMHQDEGRLKQDLAAEMGDVCWYVSQLCNELGLSMEDVMQENIDKLSDRKARDKLKGSGDTR